MNAILDRSVKKPNTYNLKGSDMKRNHWIRIIAFCIIFILLFLPANKILGHSGSYGSYILISGFYEEPEDSLDAVYIGSSNCYTFWNPSVAWETHGLAIWSYANASQPFEAAEYLIREARKTQPDALYIVNTNAVCDEVFSESGVHNMIDFMPESKNKTDLINYISDLMGYTAVDRLAFAFPWLQFHNRAINANDFHMKLDGMKGSPYFSNYLKTSADISNSYITSDDLAAVSDTLEQCVQSLLDYCDAENIDVLFVTVPRAEDSKEELERINMVNSMIREHGYTVLSLTDQVYSMGIDLETDYYNAGHTNVHGAIKYTHYLSRYLLENYDMNDKREYAEYESWNEAWNLYSPIISPYVLDIELDVAHRDFSMPKPAEVNVYPDGSNIVVEWSAVNEADAYAVYRKENGGAWESIARVQESVYKDSSFVTGTEYTYTIVPCYESGNETYYGNFSYEGISIRM